jgi:N-acetyl-gamma-glutamyl-phosphate reductase common form
MVRIGIAGGSGYAGAELIRILCRHPQAEIVWISSERHAGQGVELLYPHLRGILPLRFSPLEELSAAKLDALFLSLPHGEAARLVPQLPRSLLVIDLSGDFRIQDPEVFERYYGFPMATAIQKDFVYGLCELNRPALIGARRVSNPGCFATATALALFPLFEEGWIDGPVFADAKTGSSGSGRTPGDGTHHPRRAQAFFPYKAFRHQHQPEICQTLKIASEQLVFQTYSAPMVRGIFASHYLRTKVPVSSEQLEESFRKRYGNEPFIRWAGESVDVGNVRHSNFVDIGGAVSGRSAIVWATLDNLQKGAAGQAVQNFNLSLGFEETAGLLHPPAFP